MKKKILIGYADYGSGHKSVAEYLKNYFEEKDEFEVKLLNLSMYSNNIGKLGDKLFNQAIKNEFLYSVFFGLFNNKIASKGNLKLCVKSFNNYSLREFLKEYDPDLIISTHFYVSYMAGYYVDTGLINAKIMTVITDFDYHDWWTGNHQKVDSFIVHNDIVKNKLIAENVPSNKIYSFGIPVNGNSIHNVDDKDYVINKYSLDGHKPIYLFFAGGSEGYDYTFEYFKTLVKKNLPIEIIFIAGKNKNLKGKCENFIIKNDIKNVIVLGFTKDIFNLINISHMVITKPGGTTLNECTIMKKPCILIPGVGGQENYNARFMVKNHYGVKVRSAKGLARKVKMSLTYPFIVNSMKNKLNKVDFRDSCKNIYELVKSSIS